MFEHLPWISQDSVEAFGEAELAEVVICVNDLLAGLTKINPKLARAVRVTSDVTAGMITSDPELKHEIESECVVAILVILRLVSRALEAKEMDKKLKLERR